LSQVPGKRLLSPEASFLTLDMLRESPYPFPRQDSSLPSVPVYWKTGTSSGYRDGWTIGVFGPYVLAVWIGNFNYQGHTSFIGRTNAAPLFFNIVEAICKDGEPLKDSVKALSEMNLIKVNVCEASGLLPNPCCPNLVSTWFIPGKSPIKRDTLHREIAFNQQTRTKTSDDRSNDTKSVYNCWSSDLLTIFSQAGLPHPLCPSFKCHDLLIDELEGQAPVITSPQKGVIYTISLSKINNEIVFRANVDADVNELYWFLDNDFIGKTERDKPLIWQAKAGTFSLRVVDNHARIKVQKFTVEAVQ
jgi:penicillin-binding protein 1C